MTGIPKMRESMTQNGSPPVRLETDEEHLHFLVELPIHPAFLKAGVEAGVKAGVALNDTEVRVLRALQAGPKGVKEIVGALGLQVYSGALGKALHRLGDLGLVALTIPDKPNSRNKKRKLTDRGRRALGTIGKGSTA